jgi:hypothetical protein
MQLPEASVKTIASAYRSVACGAQRDIDPLFFRCIFSERPQLKPQPDAGPGNSLGAGADEPFSDGITALGAVA